MDIRQLRYFVALAEELHFGRAAERLHLAQPALSQQLKAMERELGVRLLDRDSRGVAVTPAGERLLGEAREVIARFDAALATMAQVRARESGTLVLGVTAGVDPALLPRLLAGLPAALDVDAVAVSNADAQEGVRRHALDAALVTAPKIVAGLARQPLVTEPLGVVLPSGHRLARRRAVRPADLDDLPLAWLRRRSEPDLYDDVMASLVAAGFAPPSVKESPNPLSSLSLVSAGLAMSLKFRRELTANRYVGVVWRPFDGVEVAVTSSLIWRRKDSRSPALRALLAAAATPSS